jgi:AraC-like DNA-binding protein
VNVTEFTPCEELAPFVRAFQVVEAAEETERTLLPDTGIIVGLRYAGSATQVEAGTAWPVPGTVITGLRATARRMRTSAGGGIALAKFSEMGARSFFAEPLHRLFGATRPLDEHVAPADVARVAQNVARAEGALERVAIFERFLLGRCTYRSPDPLVSEALSAINAAPGAIRIAALARSLGVSQDALEKRFRRVVGASPKAFASIVHFRRALDAYPRLRPTLSELALQAGFYDQSHFNRRFRSVTGAPPGRFLGSADYCYC